MTTIDANWTVEEPSGNFTCEYSLDHGALIDIGNRTNVTLKGLLEGFHDLDIRVTNHLGQDTEASVSFWIDTYSPSVQFTQEGIFYSNLDPVMVEWAATDNVSGLDRIETRLDEGNWENKGNVNRQIVTMGEDGTHLFEVRAFDKAGNWVISGKKLVLDTIRPNLELLTPSDGSIMNNSTLNITWTGGDSGSGISYYELQLDSLTPDIYKEPEPVTKENTIDGRHEIRLTAFDLAGNLRTLTATVEIDTKTPRVIQNHPGDWEVGIDETIWVSTTEMLIPETVKMNVTNITGNVTVSGGQITFLADRSFDYGTN
jgi:hypothetical protein